MSCAVPPHPCLGLQVMESTISHLDIKYGSATNYLLMIGLTPAELHSITENLTQPRLPLPAVGAPAACEPRQD